MEKQVDAKVDVQHLFLLGVVAQADQVARPRPALLPALQAGDHPAAAHRHPAGAGRDTGGTDQSYRSLG